MLDITLLFMIYHTLFIHLGELEIHDAENVGWFLISIAGLQILINMVFYLIETAKGINQKILTQSETKARSYKPNK